MFVYFSATFIYIINVLSVLLLTVPSVVCCASAVVLLITAAELKLSLDSGITLQGFFVVSTLLNASLVLGAVIAVATCLY